MAGRGLVSVAVFIGILQGNGWCTARPMPPPLTDVDCAMRSYFIEYAAKVNPNIDRARAEEMADALQGDPDRPINCSVTVPDIPSRVEPSASDSYNLQADAIYADANLGSDSAGDGSIAKPYRTVGRTVEAVRARNASNRTINLRAGTFFIEHQLELGPGDSGLTIQTFPGDAGLAWLSGAVPLAGLQWKRQTTGSGAEPAFAHLPPSANVWSADLQEVPGVPAEIRSLRIDGERGILSRYPNCNPELELCFSDKARSTTTVASKWTTRSSQPSSQYVAPAGFDRAFCPKQASTVSSRGCNVTYQMEIGGGNCELLSPSISHFCSSTQVVNGAWVNKTLAPHQPYANPVGAIFSAMHGGSWCSFTYEVNEYKWHPYLESGEFNFSIGGQQCNRPESSHGPLVIENVLEELDAPGEFFYNPITKMLTLWYNASAGTPPPADGSVVAPALTTLISLRGNQSNPVKDITIRQLGVRDTAPAVLMPHTGPSGGDWAINRNASVLAEGVDGVNITRCTFWKLDNSAIFLGGYARNTEVSDNSFAWLGESALVSLGETAGAPVPGWGADGTGGNQPMGTRVWRNYGREIGIINKQSALYFQAVTDGADVRGNIAYNGARSGANFNDCFGAGSNFSQNVFFNFNRETADHGPFNSWDRVAFNPRKGPNTRDELSRNAIWCNYNSANAFDTDDTSTYFHMYRNVQMGGWFLKSDFGGSEIEFERNLVIGGGQSNQFQPIPPQNVNKIKNCTIATVGYGENLQWRAPCPDDTANGTMGRPIEYTDVQIFVSSGPAQSAHHSAALAPPTSSTVCERVSASMRVSGGPAPCMYLKFVSALESALESGRRPEIPADIVSEHESYTWLMQSCWANDPTMRPSFDRIVSRLSGGSSGGSDSTTRRATLAPELLDTSLRTDWLSATVAESSLTVVSDDISGDDTQRGSFQQRRGDTNELMEPLLERQE